MTINMTKTKEIIFRRPNRKIDLHLPSFLGIEIIYEAKLLVVIFTNNVHVDSRINYQLKAFSKRSYLMRTLRDQGLWRKQLNAVFDAIILSRIMYMCRSHGADLHRMN